MGKWAMLFPGQGSQYAGMGKALHDEYETARHVFEEADDTLGYKLSEIVFGEDAARLTRTEYTQPALLTVSMAAYRVFAEQIGGEPNYLAGHSLGEWTALACAESLSFAEALRLVALRGRLMQEAADAGEGAMCAILGLDARIVEEACLRSTAPGAEVVVSNYNSPLQTVISGRADAVRRVVGELAGHGAKAAYLNVGAPFHSPLMAPAAARLDAELRGVTFAAPCRPVVSNVTALPHTAPQEIAGRLVAQIVSPVRWEATMKFLAGEGVSSVVELGPQTVLGRLAQANVTDMIAYSFEKPEQAATLRDNMKPLLTGVGSQTRHFVVGCLTAAVATRNRNWDAQAYQEGVIVPYRSLESIQARLEAEDRGPEAEELREAFRLLERIFRTKGVPDDESAARLQELVSRTGTETLFPEFAANAVRNQNYAAGTAGR